MNDLPQCAIWECVLTELSLSLELILLIFANSSAYLDLCCYHSWCMNSYLLKLIMTVSDEDSPICILVHISPIKFQDRDGRYQTELLWRSWPSRIIPFDPRLCRGPFLILHKKIYFGCPEQLSGSLCSLNHSSYMVGLKHDPRWKDDSEHHSQCEQCFQSG